MTKLEDSVNEILGIEKKCENIKVEDFSPPVPKKDNLPEKAKEILNSLKNCGCVEYENLKMHIN